MLILSYCLISLVSTHKAHAIFILTSQSHVEVCEILLLKEENVRLVNTTTANFPAKLHIYKDVKTLTLTKHRTAIIC